MEKRFAAPRCSFLRTERAEAIMTARLPRLNQFIVDHKASTSTAEEALQYREARFFSVDWTTVYGPETCSAYSREIKDFKKLIFAYKSQPRFHDSEADVASVPSLLGFFQRSLLRFLPSQGERSFDRPHPSRGGGQRSPR